MFFFFCKKLILNFNRIFCELAIRSNISKIVELAVKGDQKGEKVDVVLVAVELAVLQGVDVELDKRIRLGLIPLLHLLSSSTIKANLHQPFSLLGI